MTKHRLQKLIAQAGVASRRKAETLITEGRVKVNGKVVKELGVKADPVRDRITVDGKVLSQEDRAYILFHKPAKVITSLSDPEGRETVADFCPRWMPRVFPVGRLDWDCQGLLLLTNDGDLANGLSHPRRNVPKTYRAKLNGPPPEESLDRLREGIELEDGPTAPAHEVALESVRAGKAWVRLVIHEGRNRQVKRMFEAIGFQVLKLRREAYAGLTVQGLPVGMMRALSPAEIRALLSTGGLQRTRKETEDGIWVPRRTERGGPHGPFWGRPPRRRRQRTKRGD